MVYVSPLDFRDDVLHGGAIAVKNTLLSIRSFIIVILHSRANPSAQKGALAARIALWKVIIPSSL